MDEIKAATKKFIKIPTTYHEFVDRLRLYKGFLTVFFGDNNPVVDQVDALSKNVVKFAQNMKAAGLENVKFYASFLYKVDL